MLGAYQALTKLALDEFRDIISSAPEDALRQVLGFVRRQLS